MVRKIKIFDREIEWYDVKTKFKKVLRQITYSFFVQELICFLLSSYMWFVYATSKRKFINSEIYLKNAKENRAMICAFWHNRLVMIPFVARFAKRRGNKNYNFMTLASNHGDGRFVGKVMKKFGFENIYGSTKEGRKASRGIDMSSVRQIIRGLKNGKCLGITPDGPRGPNQKINGEIINIAKIGGAVIMPISYSTSNFIEFKSWDKFKLPLPFSKLNFYFGEEVFVDKDAGKEQEEKLKKELEKAMDLAQEKSMQF